MLKKHVIATFFACTLVLTNAHTEPTNNPSIYEDWGFVEEKLFYEPSQTPALLKIIPWLTGAGMLAGAGYLAYLTYKEESTHKDTLSGSWNTSQTLLVSVNKKKLILGFASLLTLILTFDIATLAKSTSQSLYDNIKKPAYNAVRDYVINWPEYKFSTPTILHPIFKDAHEKYTTSYHPENYIQRNYMKILRQVMRLSHIE